MSTIQAVAVTGSLSAPSKSSSLAQLMLSALGELTDVRPYLVEIAQVGPLLGHGLSRAGLPLPARTALELVENAHVLVVATPVYRGSYTGIFKHFFDLVEQHALVDVPVILAATGGSARHSLMIEHALRPLFACFRAQTVPTAIYATDGDFETADAVSAELGGRIDLAAKQAVRLLTTTPHVVPRQRELGARQAI